MCTFNTSLSGILYGLRFSVPSVVITFSVKNALSLSPSLSSPLSCCRQSKMASDPLKGPEWTSRRVVWLSIAKNPKQSCSSLSAPDFFACVDIQTRPTATCLRFLDSRRGEGRGGKRGKGATTPDTACIFGRGVSPFLFSEPSPRRPRRPSTQ